MAVMSVCTGPEDAKQLVYRSDFLQEERYYFAGILMAMSLFHGGPAPSFFSDSFYKAFCGHEILLEVFNEEVSLALKCLKEATDLNTLNNVLENPYLVLAGCPPAVTDVSRKKVVLEGKSCVQCF